MISGVDTMIMAVWIAERSFAMLHLKVSLSSIYCYYFGIF